MSAPIRIAAAVIRDRRGRLLLVRKRGTSTFMQPAAKSTQTNRRSHPLARCSRSSLAAARQMSSLSPAPGAVGARRHRGWIAQPPRGPQAIRMLATNSPKAAFTWAAEASTPVTFGSRSGALPRLSICTCRVPVPSGGTRRTSQGAFWFGLAHGAKASLTSLRRAQRRGLNHHQPGERT